MGQGIYNLGIGKEKGIKICDLFGISLMDSWWRFIF